MRRIRKQNNRREYFFPVNRLDGGLALKRPTAVCTHQSSQYRCVHCPTVWILFCACSPVMHRTKTRQMNISGTFGSITNGAAKNDMSKSNRESIAVFLISKTNFVFVLMHLATMRYYMSFGGESPLVCICIGDSLLRS